MKKLIALPGIAAALTFTAGASFADGHSGYNPNNYEVAVPAGLCPESKRSLALWAYGKPEFTTFAVPTSRGAECGDAGQRVTAGIAESASEAEARKAALGVCNENRGSLGRCVVIGTVRLKQ